VEQVNERGAGVIQIDVRGGPEAIGPFQQADAVRDGVVDMAYTARLVLCRRTAGKGRDGHLEPHRGRSPRQWRDRPDQRNPSGAHGVYYLGWFDSGVCYNLWSVNEPQLDADGNLAMTDVRLRGNPVYNAFFTNYLGAQVIDLPTGEVLARWSAASSTPPAGPRSALSTCAGTISSTGAWSLASSRPTLA
jgi:TRAP-type transport system periplasmic protein